VKGALETSDSQYVWEAGAIYMEGCQSVQYFLKTCLENPVYVTFVKAIYAASDGERIKNG
jgi:hypothetical protein